MIIGIVVLVVIGLLLFMRVKRLESLKIESIKLDQDSFGRVIDVTPTNVTDVRTTYVMDDAYKPKPITVPKLVDKQVKKKPSKKTNADKKEDTQTQPKNAKTAKSTKPANKKPQATTPKAPKKPKMTVAK